MFKLRKSVIYGGPQNSTVRFFNLKCSAEAYTIPLKNGFHISLLHCVSFYLGMFWGV